MGECETDLGTAVEGPMDADHSQVYIYEMDRPAITQGTMQVDTNTRVENTMLLPIIKGKVLKRQELSVAYLLEEHSAYSSKATYMEYHSIAQCKDVASFENADVFNELGRAFKPWESGHVSGILAITLII